MEQSNTQDDLKIFLSGFMAAGKSTVGRRLAAALGCDFTDLDQEITRRERRSVKNIFKEDGEEHFRKLERETLDELSRNFSGVVSLGGGSLQNQEIVNRLKKRGTLIYIHTPMGEILERVYRNPKRPILYGQNGEKKSKEVLLNELRTLYSKREKFYRQAHYQFDTADFNDHQELLNNILQSISDHA